LRFIAATAAALNHLLISYSQALQYNIRDDSQRIRLNEYDSVITLLTSSLLIF